MAKASGSTRKGGGKTKAGASRAVSAKKTAKKAPAKKTAKKPAAKAAGKAAKPSKAKPAKSAKPAKAEKVAGAKGAKPAKGANPSKSAGGAKAPSKPTTKVEKAAKPSKPARKPAGKKGAKEKPPPPPPPSLASMQAAASKLAAAAGLRPVESGSSSSSDGGTGKPRRVSRSPLSSSEVDAYRRLLIHKRGEIVGDVSAMEEEALTGGSSGSLSHTPQHMAEQGSDTFDQSLSLDLAASQRKLLKEIDEALERIDAGTYGVCTDMGVPIGKTRLDAKPWAKHCIEAARLHERRGS